MNVAVECAYFAVNEQKEAIISQKYKFSSNTFPLSTTRWMAYSQMVLIQRFYETFVVDSTEISLSGYFPI